MSYIRCRRPEIGRGRGSNVTGAVGGKCYGSPANVTVDAGKTRNVALVTLVTQFREDEPGQDLLAMTHSNSVVLAKLYEQLGQPEKAKETLEKFREAKAKSPAVKR